MNSVLGFNVRTLGVGRDNIIASARALGGKYLLAHDDPELAAVAAANGFSVIYRQTEDGAPQNDPAAFVAERAKNAPAAAYLHLTNELDPTPELLTWTMEAMRYADSIKRKVCILNYSTGRSVSQWIASRGVAAEAVRRGHGIGFHIYDSIHVDDARRILPPFVDPAWANLKHELGGRWLVTEFGYAVDAYNGWRGDLSEQAYADFCRAWLPTFAAEGMPALLFSYDHWQPNEYGKAHGFGVNDAPTLLNALAALNVQFPLPEAPPVQPTPPPTAGAPLAMTVNATPSLKLRADIPDGTVIRLMPFNEVVTSYPATRQHAGAYDWLVTTDALGNTGWAAAIYLTPTSTPTPAFKLREPFKEYVITSRFNDPRNYPFAPDKKQLHEGIDGIDGLAQQYDTDPIVHVGAAGTVVKIGFDAQGYGNYCIVDFGNNWRGWYAHFEAMYVKEGQKLVDRQILGLMGGTGGTSTAPHCHITLQHIGQGLDGYVVADVVDPLPFLVSW